MVTNGVDICEEECVRANNNKIHWMDLMESLVVFNILKELIFKDNFVLLIFKIYSII